MARKNTCSRYVDEVEQNSTLEVAENYERSALNTEAELTGDRVLTRDFVLEKFSEVFKNPVFNFR